MKNVAECLIVKECLIIGFDMNSRTNILTVRTLNGTTYTVSVSSVVGMEKLSAGYSFYFNHTIFDMSEINKVQRLLKLKAFL